MWSGLGLRPILIAAALIVTPTFSHAECSADFRKIELTNRSSEPSESNVSPEVVSFRSYLCRTGIDPNSPQIRVEFHRLSDGAASTLVQKRPSAGLKKVFGAPRIIENEVFKTYADLLDRFGAIPTKADFGPSLWVQVPKSDGTRVDDELSTDGVRTLINISSSDHIYNLFYPAANEIEALRTRSLPAPLKYYYRQDSGTGTDPYTTVFFWRSLRPDDVTNYAVNAKALNRLLRQLRGKKHNDDNDTTTTVPVMLKLLQYIAGDRWPNDFVIMYASVNAKEMIKRSDAGGEGCGDEFIGNLAFEIPYPTIILDTVLIENVSNVPVKIDSLHGSQSSMSTLRALGSDSAKLTNASFDMSQTLAPGERLLVPTRITFVPQVWDGAPATNNVADWSKLLRTSTQVQKKIGTSGLRATEANHAVPLLKTYLFGPELSIAGLTVNGKLIDLEQRSANFSDLVMSSEALSCPYLLSWDAANRTWVEHGKVLDKAPNQTREYSEPKWFPGFRSRFRVEEREPEIAFIKEVELVATLNNGMTITLKPTKVVTAAEREGDYLSLYWGQAADFDFMLPPNITEEQIVASRFTVTGYYRRYSALLAQAGGLGLSGLSPHPMAASNP